MNKTISEKLKKRVFFDTVFGCILCFTALGAAVWQFIGYLNHTNLTEYLTNSLYSLVIFAELGLLSLILLEIRKTGKPFSNKIIMKLRIMSIILFASVFIPSYSTVALDDTQYAVSVSYDMHNLLLIALGVTLGITSEIFSYGLSLQEDNDMIA